MSDSATSVIPSKVSDYRKSHLRQVFEGSAWNGLAVSISRLAPSFLTILLAWWLDPKELGSVAFVLAYYGVLSLFADWSIAYSLQRLIPENIAPSHEIAWTALYVRLLFSITLASLCWVLDATTHIFRGYGLHLGLLLVASSFGLIVFVHGGRCNFPTSSLLNVLFQIGWIATALLMVKAGMRITGPLIALAFSYVLFGLPAFLLYSPRNLGRFSWRVAVEMIRFGTWATLASVLAGVAAQSGLLALAYLAGDTSAGIYRVASTFGMLPAVLGMVVVTPLMPVAKRGMLDGTDVTESLILPLLRYLLMVGLFIAITAAAFAQSIIAALVRDTYSSAVWPMCICLAANVSQMLVTALSGILLMGEGLKALSKIQATIAFISVIGSVVLCPSLGANGAAVAYFAACVVGAVLLYRWFALKRSIRLEWGSYARYAMSALASAAVAYLGTEFIVSPLIRSIVGAGFAGILYALILCVLRDVGLMRLLRALKRSFPARAALVH